MASVQSTQLSSSDSERRSYSWSLGAGDTGKPAPMSEYPDKTYQVTGTFGSLTLRGSNIEAADDTNAAHWFTLHDPQGNDLTLTANGGALIAENPLWISPITTGGSGYVITIVGFSG